METISRTRCWGGIQKTVRHDSDATGTPMNVSIFLPPAAESGPVPVLYFLSGLTCTEENVTAKAGAQRFAAEQDSPSSRRTPVRADSIFRVSTMIGTSGAARASTSIRRKRRGRITTGMYEYVTEELLGDWRRRSRSTPRVPRSRAIPWVATARS